MTNHLPTHLRATPPQQRNKSREQEPGSLPRTRLRASHQISVGNPDRDRVLLNGGGLVVAAERGSPHKLFAQHVRLEPIDRLGNILSGSLHRNIVVLFLKLMTMFTGSVICRFHYAMTDFNVSRTPKQERGKRTREYNVRLLIKALRRRGETHVRAIGIV